MAIRYLDNSIAPHQLAQKIICKVINVSFYKCNITPMPWLTIFCQFRGGRNAVPNHLASGCLTGKWKVLFISHAPLEGASLRERVAMRLQGGNSCVSQRS